MTVLFISSCRRPIQTIVVKVNCVTFVSYVFSRILYYGDEKFTLLNGYIYKKKASESLGSGIVVRHR
jgi:hypothetical protein